MTEILNYQNDEHYCKVMSDYLKSKGADLEKYRLFAYEEDEGKMLARIDLINPYSGSTKVFNYRWGYFTNENELLELMKKWYE